MKYSVWHRSLASTLIPLISSLTISSCGLHRLVLELYEKRRCYNHDTCRARSGFENTHPLAMVAIRQRGHCHCDDAHGNLRKRQNDRFSRRENRFPRLRWNIPRLVLVRRTGGAGGLSSSLDIFDTTFDPCANRNWPINYFYLQSEWESIPIMAKRRERNGECGLWMRMRMPEQCARESHIISLFYFSL